MDAKLSVTYTFANGASQHVNMSLDAYNFFIDNTSVPRNTTPSHWKKLPLVKKVEWYLDDMKKDLGAVDVSYKIMKG